MLILRIGAKMCQVRRTLKSSRNFRNDTQRSTKNREFNRRKFPNHRTLNRTPQLLRMDLSTTLSARLKQLNRTLVLGKSKVIAISLSSSLQDTQINGQVLCKSIPGQKGKRKHLAVNEARCPLKNVDTTRADHALHRQSSRDYFS